MRPESSPRGTGAVAPDRFSNESRPTPAAATAYRTLLPTLPTGKMSENAVFLHADPSARPYGIDDIVDAISAVADLKTIINLGPFQFNHVWMVTFRTEKEMQQLASQTEIKAKGRRCLVINPNQQEKEVRIHWMPPKAPDELLTRQFTRFGRVLRVVREGWRRPGLEHMTSTTRVVHIIPREPNSLDAVPHQALINGNPILIDVPGRPPMCLRCRQIGHIRRLCTTPWCRACRSFGHLQADCSQSYAARTRQPATSQSLEEYMDAEEMAAMSVPLTPVPSPPSEEEPLPAPLTHPPAVETSWMTETPPSSAASGAQGLPQTQNSLSPPPQCSDGAHESGAAPRELKEPVAEQDGEASPTNAEPATDVEQRSEEAKPTDVEGEEAAPLNDQPGGTSCDDADDELPTKVAAAPRKPDNSTGVETRRKARGKQGVAVTNKPSQGDTGPTTAGGGSTSGRT